LGAVLPASEQLPQPQLLRRQRSGTCAHDGAAIVQYAQVLMLQQQQQLHHVAASHCAQTPHACMSA
jgi:hypothetical protein